MAQKVHRLVDSPVGSIDQIREIIFGDQMIELKKQIDDLKKKCQELSNKITGLEKKQTKLDQQMTEDSEQKKSTQLDQQQVIEQLKQEFDQKIAELNHVKVDKSQIGQAFIEWGMKVKETATNQS